MQASSIMPNMRSSKLQNWLINTPEEIPCNFKQWLSDGLSVLSYLPQIADALQEIMGKSQNYLSSGSQNDRIETLCIVEMSLFVTWHVCMGCHNCYNPSISRLEILQVIVPTSLDRIRLWQMKNNQAVRKTRDRLGFQLSKMLLKRERERNIESSVRNTEAGECSVENQQFPPVCRHHNI